MKKIIICTILSLFCLINLTNFQVYLTAEAVDEQQTDTVPSRNYTVVIDPGHGGSDPGSIGYKTKIGRCWYQCCYDKGN